MIYKLNRITHMYDGHYSCESNCNIANINLMTVTQCLMIVLSNMADTGHCCVICYVSRSENTLLLQEKAYDQWEGVAVSVNGVGGGVWL